MEFTKHLLVDGSNLVHAWPELRRTLRTEGPEIARGRLVEQLRPIHDTERSRVTIVFDGRGAELSIDRPSGENTFSVLYTPSGTTADDVIEQLVAQAKPPALTTVATGDQAERETIEALGAHWVSPDQLDAWVKRSGAAQSSAVRENNQRTARAWHAR